MTAPDLEHGWQLAGSSADAYEQLLVPSIFEAWAQGLVDLAAPRPGEHVLDAACGTGVVARAAASRVGPDGTVTGVDVNAGMLATARRTDSVIAWRHADVTALPFPDGTFVLVLCQQGFQFMADRDAAARELRRVLARPGRRRAPRHRGTRRPRRRPGGRPGALRRRRWPGATHQSHVALAAAS